VQLRVHRVTQRRHLINRAESSTGSTHAMRDLRFILGSHHSVISVLIALAERPLRAISARTSLTILLAIVFL